MVLKYCHEPFIPFRRKDIIDLCLADKKLDEKSTEEFRSFCKILSAYFHFKFQSHLETLQDNYAIFDPDLGTYPLGELSLDTIEKMGDNVIQVFKHVLERANYLPMPQEVIHQSLEHNSLVALSTQVDFDDFDQIICYYRGDTDTDITMTKFFFWKNQKTINIVERLVLLIKFKGDGYFRAKQTRIKQELTDLKFTPGKIYVYFYKNIPKLDLDLLFPNIQTSMTWRDRLMLMVPAIGAAIPIVLKTIPNILLLIAAILIAINAQSTVETLDVEPEQARNVMPVLIATLTLTIALGGFAFRQYNQYKNKKIKFQKDVTDTLFFKNLATNASVFHMLLSLAEEEECKEIILVYYHLLTSAGPLTAEMLDQKIETWMLERTGVSINFDIHGPLNNLKNIRGYLSSIDQEKSLLSCNEQGHCQVLPLREARVILDYLWDNAFQYQ